MVKDDTYGELAQLGEHLLCKQGVSGSIPLFSIASRKASMLYIENWIVTNSFKSNRKIALKWTEKQHKKFFKKNGLIAGLKNDQLINLNHNFGCIG